VDPTTDQDRGVRSPDPGTPAGSTPVPLMLRQNPGTSQWWFV